MTIAEFTMLVEHMHDMGEWVDTPDDEAREAFHTALYALLYASNHDNFTLIDKWVNDNDAHGYLS